MYKISGRVEVNFDIKAPDDNSLEGRDDWRPAMLRLTGDAKEVKVAGGVDEDDELATLGDISRDIGCDPVIINTIIAEHKIKVAKCDSVKLYDYAEVMDAASRHPDYFEYVSRSEFIALAGTSAEYLDRVIARGLAPQGKKFGNRILYKAADADMLTSVVYKMISDDDRARKVEASRKSKEYQRQWRVRHAGERKANTQTSVEKARARGLIPVTDLIKEAGISVKSLTEDIKLGMIHVTEKTGGVRYFSHDEVNAYLKLLSGYSLLGAARAVGVHVNTLRKLEEAGVFQVIHFSAHRLVVLPEEMEKAREYMKRGKKGFDEVAHSLEKHKEVV